MASDDPTSLQGQRHVKRERVLRTLTFWLRPDFVLRVVSRFQKLVGFDRAIALASGALMATIPLMIVIGSVSSQLGGRDTAERLFNTYATRYGVIGAVFAMISALFCVCVVLVVSTAAGREVRDELDRIRRGETPAADEVQRQWQEVTAQARSRWEILRAQIQERRRRREEG
jgi:uncharacterized BrkB/YihY/UPF0761 family membrane protein